MTCDAVRPFLSDHFDGRFHPGEARRLEIEAHLACCPPCAGILADYDRIRQAVRPETCPLPDAGAFERRLQGRLAAEPARRRAWFPAAAAAGLALALGASWVLRDPAGRHPATPVPSPAPVASAHPASPPPASWRFLADLRDTTPPMRAEALGLSMRPVDTDLASTTQAALVEVVDPGSPAAAAGLLPGDLILSVNGRPVARLDPAAWTGQDAPGRCVRLEVLGQAGGRRPLELVAAPCR